MAKRVRVERLAFSGKCEAWKRRQVGPRKGADRAKGAVLSAVLWGGDPHKKGRRKPPPGIPHTARLATSHPLQSPCLLYLYMRTGEGKALDGELWRTGVQKQLTLLRSQRLHSAK